MILLIILYQFIVEVSLGNALSFLEMIDCDFNNLQHASDVYYTNQVEYYLLFAVVMISQSIKIELLVGRV